MPNSERQPLLYTLQIALLRSVSPSNFSVLDSCLLRSACRAARNTDLLPSPQNNRVGTVAHTLLEEAGRGKMGGGEAQLFEERWEALIVQEEERMLKIPLQRRFVPLSKHIANYEVTRYRAVNQASVLARNHVLQFDSNEHTEPPIPLRGSPAAEGTIFYERFLSTPDGKVKGRLDYCQETPEGAILRDYKTGSIWDKVEPSTRILKKDYELQMKLYAALYQANTGCWPLRLEVAPLDEPAVEVSFSPEEASGLLLKATKTLDDCNARIQVSIDRETLEELATPSPQTCGYCTFRPGCSAYWKFRTDSAEPGWPHDVAGRLIEKQKLGNGKWLLKIQTSASESVSITLSAGQELYPELNGVQTGDFCAFYSMKPRFGSSDSLIETPFTLLQSSVNSPQGEEKS